MNGLIWIHQLIADTGLLDRILAGDQTTCSIVGVLIGCCIAPGQLKRQLEENG